MLLAAALVIIVACTALPKPKRGLIRQETVIALILGVTLIVNLICTGPMYTLLTLMDGDGMISEASMASAIDANIQIAEEGMVLLKNEGGLPLSGGTKLNVFGWSSTNPVYSGTGAGSINDKFEKVSILDSLEKAGFELNKDISDFYVEFQDSRPGSQSSVTR